jgi:hypothetical protein
MPQKQYLHMELTEPSSSVIGIGVKTNIEQRFKPFKKPVKSAKEVQRDLEMFDMMLLTAGVILN